MNDEQKRRFAKLILDSRAHYERLKPLAQSIADRAYVERPHWTQLDGDDYARDKAKVLRRVWFAVPLRGPPAYNATSHAAQPVRRGGRSASIT